MHANLSYRLSKWWLILITTCLFFLLCEVSFYTSSFNTLFQERIFQFDKPDYINGWLIAYITVSVLLRATGLLNFLFNNRPGKREFIFGQLMLLALICREIFEYITSAYYANTTEVNNWKLFLMLGILAVEFGFGWLFLRFQEPTTTAGPEPVATWPFALLYLSLIGCCLNSLTIIHDIYLFSNKDYLAEYIYLIVLSTATLLSFYGLYKIMEKGYLIGFKYYGMGQMVELVFYLVVFLFITIPDKTNRTLLENKMAEVSFLKNSIPVATMLLAHYLLYKKQLRKMSTESIR